MWLQQQGKTLIPIFEMLDLKGKCLQGYRHQNLLSLSKTRSISKVQCLIIIETFERETFQCDTFYTEGHIFLLLLEDIIPIFNTFWNSKESLKHGDILIQWDYFLGLIYAALPGFCLFHATHPSRSKASDNDYNMKSACFLFFC